jgi:uncharacterized protein YjbI with pentapeptide repeats
MTTKTVIGAAEFVTKVLAGERNFANTRFAPSDSDLAAQPAYAQMLEYLRGLTDMRDAPFQAGDVDWSGIRAPRLHFIGVRMAGAKLSGADLRGAKFVRADLSRADLRGADVSQTVFVGARLMEADFTGATMREVDLYEANVSKSRLRDADITGGYLLRLNLSGADLTGARVVGVDLYRSDLRGVIGLDAAQGLSTCRFKDTIVTEREKDIVDLALQDRRLFDLRSE